MNKEKFNKYMSAFVNMDEKARYGIFAAILLLIFLADYFIIMRTQLNGLAKINADIEVKIKDIAQAKENIAKTSKYEENVEELKSKLSEINSRVKSSDELSFILESISNMADKNKVKLDQLMPNPQSKKMLLENQKRKYYAYPVLLEGRSTYHDFGRFLHLLEISDICIKVGNFSILSMDKSKYHAISLDLSAIVYEKVYE